MKETSTQPVLCMEQLLQDADRSNPCHPLQAQGGAQSTPLAAPQSPALLPVQMREQQDVRTWFTTDIWYKSRQKLNRLLPNLKNDVGHCVTQHLLLYFIPTLLPNLKNDIGHCVTQHFLLYFIPPFPISLSCPGQTNQTCKIPEEGTSPTHIP